MAETKLSTAQLGGNAKVWNENNLKGSTSVSISEIQKPVIDSDTYGVWHLDDSSANAVTSSLWAGWVDGNGSYTTSDAAKFGTARDLGTDSSTSKIHIYNTNGTRTTLSAVSVDFWLRPTFMDSSTKWNILSVPNSSNGIYNVYSYYVRISSNKIELYDNNTVVGTHATTINTTDFHHYAVSATSAKIKVYFDGVKIFDVARSGQIPLWTDTINGTENRAGLFVVGSRYTVIDEIRVSGIDRWADQDRFTLFTEPYAPAGSDPEYEVKLAASVTSAIEAKANSADLSTVATTGAYSDLSGTPTIPTVNNATLTITQGGTTKGTFTANASADVTIDLGAGGGVAPTTATYTNQTGTTLATGLTLSNYDTIMVFLNGALQAETTTSPAVTNDYSISGNNIVFTEALIASDTVTLVCLGEVSGSGSGTDLTTVTGYSSLVPVQRLSNIQGSLAWQTQEYWYTNFSQWAQLREQFNYPASFTNVDLLVKFSISRETHHQNVIHFRESDKSIFYQNSSSSSPNTIGYWDGATSTPYTDTISAGGDVKWLRLTGTNGNLSVYVLNDNNYQPETLPALSSWSYQFDFPVSLGSSERFVFGTNTDIGTGSWFNGNIRCVYLKLDDTLVADSRVQDIGLSEVLNYSDNYYYQIHREEHWD